MLSVYYERKLYKAVPYILLEIVLPLALIAPINETVRSHFLFRLAVVLLMLITFVLGILVVLRCRPVLTIADGKITLRGLRPGFLKLIQIWQEEEVKIEEVEVIRVGKIREPVCPSFPNLLLPPLSVPSRQARLQKFLWLTYLKEGKKMDLYYPHTPMIAGFENALKELRGMFGTKVVEYSGKV